MAVAHTAERPQVIRIPNGARAAPMFSAGEMERRLAALRGLLERSGIDAALFTSIHNVNYFADFLYCSFGRPYGLVVTPDAATSVSANIDGGQPFRRRFGDNVVYTDWQRDNYYRAAAGLLAGARRVGVEFDHLTLQGRAKLEAALPGAELVDISPGTMALRMLKSDEEIAVIREGARIRTWAGPPASRPSARASPSTRSRCTPRGRWCARSRAPTRTPS